MDQQSVTHAAYAKILEDLHKAYGDQILALHAERMSSMTCLNLIKWNLADILNVLTDHCGRECSVELIKKVWARVAKVQMIAGSAYNDLLHSKV
jgi:hypothetical protein